MFNPFRPSKPAVGKLVPASALYAAIRRDHKRIEDPLSPSKIRLADTTYQTVTEEQARLFLARSASFWQPEINDCDDQAWMAKSEAIKAQKGQKNPLAFGVLWTEDHALNWYMDAQLKVRLIDQEQYKGVLTRATLWLG